MKKIAYSLFLLMAAALLLSSCASQLSTVSVTKRHYRNGYYVDMGNAKHKTEVTSPKTIVPAIDAVPVTQTAAANNVSETPPVKAVTTAGTMGAPKNKKDIVKELSASTIKHSASGNPKPVITPNTLTEIKNIQAISKSIASESKSHDHSNGGLIWTIIIILLILWLLGLLLGWALGGLLYVLVVIALILILLRLLGVI